MNIDLLQEILTNSTPGPWEWNRSDHTCWLGAPQIDVLRSISSGYSGETDIDIDEPNARLIAMAPDLAAEVLRLRAEVERLTEALTPSRDTKAAYMGEIHCDCPTENWKHFVPWTSIKEIMAMIRARAALKAKGTE